MEPVDKQLNAESRTALNLISGNSCDSWIVLSKGKNDDPRITRRNTNKTVWELDKMFDLFVARLKDY